MINYIFPNWDIKEFKNLQYSFSTYKDKSVINQYVKSGHNQSMISLYNYHEPNTMPNCIFEYIKPQFNFLSNIAFAINYFKPGQYLPLHSDLYGKYIEVYNEEPKKIIRFIIMLEDSFPGQILQIKDTTYCTWNAGDCFYWKYDEIHAFYNFSMNDRYAIQITGAVK